MIMQTNSEPPFNPTTMDYRNNTSGAIESQSEILAKYPNTSFPKPVSSADIVALGYSTILDVVKPTTTPPYEYVEPDGLEQKDGQWYRKYKVSTATGDHKTSIDTNKAKDVRRGRDSALAASDWTQAADSPLSSDKKTEWATYRASLRDVPSLSGFPHSHTDPTKPS